MALLQNQADVPEDQQYICNEYKRANGLILELSKRAQTASERKLELEKAIMERAGVDDSELWTELKQVREEVIAYGQEKLLLIAKMYNLAQKFDQELEDSNKQMQN